MVGLRNRSNPDRRPTEVPVCWSHPTFATSHGSRPVVLAQVARGIVRASERGLGRERARGRFAALRAAWEPPAQPWPPGRRRQGFAPRFRADNGRNLKCVVDGLLMPAMFRTAHGVLVRLVGPRAFRKADFAVIQQRTLFVVDVADGQGVLHGATGNTR